MTNREILQIKLQPSPTGNRMIEVDSNHWHGHFIDISSLVASKSKDRSTKVGAVIVGPDREIRSTGYNGFPRGISDLVECRHNRPEKYLFTEHAERNAIFNAARIGTSLKGCTLYMNYQPIPCADCTRAIIQSGISSVVGPNIQFPGVGEQWKASLEASEQMLEEAGIKRYIYEPLIPVSSGQEKSSANQEE